jgi:Transcriptional regulatory protein, C terminal
LPGGSIASPAVKSSFDLSGGATPRGDRSVDVYVRKLRVKLEQALPAWRFIHTHFGFGYRLAAERTHEANNGFTTG